MAFTEANGLRCHCKEAPRWTACVSVPRGLFVYMFSDLARVALSPYLRAADNLVSPAAVRASWRPRCSSQGYALSAEWQGFDFKPESFLRREASSRMNSALSQQVLLMLFVWWLPVWLLQHNGKTRGHLGGMLMHFEIGRENQNKSETILEYKYRQMRTRIFLNDCILSMHLRSSLILLNESIQNKWIIIFFLMITVDIMERYWCHKESIWFLQARI